MSISATAEPAPPSALIDLIGLKFRTDDEVALNAFFNSPNEHDQDRWQRATDAMADLLLGPAWCVGVEGEEITGREPIFGTEDAAEKVFLAECCVDGDIIAERMRKGRGRELVEVEVKEGDKGWLLGGVDAFKDR